MVLIETTPFAGCVTDCNVRTSPSTSVSFTRTRIIVGVSCGVTDVSFTATGLSLTAAILIDTVAMLLSAVPSFVLYVKLSLPLKSGLGE